MTSPSPCVAAATATALDPDAVVSPTPRSQTRAVTSPGRSTRATCTFVRSGKRGCVSSRGPSSSDLARVAHHDGVRVADRDRDQLDAVDDLRRPDLHPAQLRLVETVLGAPHHDASWVRRARAPPPSRAAHQPGGGDPRPVAGHLGVRAVGVDDGDRDVVALDRQHLDRAVRAGQVEAGRRALMNEIDVPVCVPARRFQRRSPPGAGRPRR